MKDFKQTTQAPIERENKLLKYGAAVAIGAISIPAATFYATKNWSSGNGRAVALATSFFLSAALSVSPVLYKTKEFNKLEIDRVTMAHLHEYKEKYHYITPKELITDVSLAFVTNYFTFKNINHSPEINTTRITIKDDLEGDKIQCNYMLSGFQDYQNMNLENIPFDEIKVDSININSNKLTSILDQHCKDIFKTTTQNNSNNLGTKFL